MRDSIEHIKELGQGLGNRYKLHLGVFDKDNKFVGWSWGIPGKRFDILHG